MSSKEFDDFMNNEYEAEHQFFFFTQNGMRSYIATKTVNSVSRSVSRLDRYMLTKTNVTTLYGTPVWIQPGPDTKTLKGYKAFKRDWTCRGKQYKVGETFVEQVKPIPCVTGMHFCLKIVDVFYYYGYDLSKTKVAEVEASGLITTNDGEKFCTDNLKIIREVPPEEVLSSIRQNVGSRLCASGMPYVIVEDVCGKLTKQNMETLAELRKKGIK